MSVVIPTLNEAEQLPHVLEALREAARGAIEVIVSDCDSGDDTTGVAEAAGARVVRGGTCRAAALNAGAAAARGGVVLFLHADTRLPRGFDEAIRAAIAGGCVGGCFEFSFGSHSLNRGRRRQLLKIVTIINRIRFRYSRRFFGDQAIFARRDVFDRLGGFPLLPLMEDAYFSARLARQGPTAILQPPAKTSPRRFIQRGVVRQFFLDSTLIFLDNLGVKPSRLWEAYNALNASALNSAGGSGTSRSPSRPRPSPPATASSGPQTI